MHKWLTMLGWIALHLSAFSKDPDPAPIPPEDVPDVSECIPPWVSARKKPEFFPFHNALVIPVIAENETAQIHTLQGLNHLHGGWDYEASRHFATAMKADPRCLIAHWGMAMSLLATSPETDAYQIATAKRLLQLVNENEGSELDRSLAYAFFKLIEDGPDGAEIALRKISNKYPRDIQVQILTALFSRGGYDSEGNITPAQAEAETRLKTLVERLPNHSVPLHAWLLVQSEAPNASPPIELAKKLCELVPNYPPYLQILGHYQWRSGDFSLAESNFALAEKLYAAWMKDHKISPADCPQWVLVRSYRAIALSSAEKFDRAISLATEISKTPLDPKRPYAPGTRQILWDATSLHARILLHRGEKGDPALALAALPTPDSMKFYRKHSLSHWWLDGLRIALETQRLLNKGDLKKATETINALSFHGESMAKQQSAASKNNEFLEWQRSFHALESLAANFQGQLSMVGPPENRGSAYNWFLAASDRQRMEMMMSTPLILTPMTHFLGDYFLSTNEPQKALQAFEETLKKFPKDPRTLQRIEKTKKIISGN